MTLETKIKEALSKVTTFEENRITPKNGLSSGSTLVNLGVSGNISIGYVVGGVYLFVGDSGAGKTWFALNAFAEAARTKRFDNYSLVYDNSEDGALMDIKNFFGSKVAQRLRPPKTEKDGTPIFSETVEDFYFNATDHLSKGPCIYILDSMDALSSIDDDKKFEERKRARRDHKQITGSYGMSKAKANSENMRQLLKLARKSKSIVIIICQTRDNVDIMSFEKKTRAGGKSLRFYSTLEFWLSVKEKIKKTIKGKPRQIGITVKMQIKKNRISGKEWAVEFPIFLSYGIDDIGSCIDYLLEEQYWSKDGQKINASDFGFCGTRDSLIKKIENDNLTDNLRRLVGEVWDEIEVACKANRKPRYE